VFGRSKSRTHSEQLVDELSQSYGHLKMAAAHAAGGAAERMTPSYDRARIMAARRWGTTKGTFSPLYDQIREGAANARGVIVVGRKEPEMKRNKWPMVMGLVAAGAAAGAAGAMIARRRRVAAQWDEYDPMPSLEESPYGEHKSSTTQRVTAGAASVADSVSSQAGKLADNLHERSSKSTPDNTFAPFAEPDETPKPSKATPKPPKTP
jgi:hypothetical protein